MRPPVDTAGAGAGAGEGAGGDAGGVAATHLGGVQGEVWHPRARQGAHSRLPRPGPHLGPQ
eukprot:5244060-Pyramimonas_sp.AAC.1